MCLWGWGVEELLRGVTGSRSLSCGFNKCSRLSSGVGMWGGVGLERMAEPHLQRGEGSFACLVGMMDGVGMSRGEMGIGWSGNGHRMEFRVWGWEVRGEIPWVWWDHSRSESGNREMGGGAYKDTAGVGGQGSAGVTPPADHIL